MKKYKFAVVLSGCGVFDGTEIHESVCTFLAIERAGASYHCLAPNIEQAQVINHLTGLPAVGETRNVLVESARIGRGKVEDIASASIDDFDALVFPGGFGAAKNLSDFAFQGENCRVDPDVQKFTLAFHQAKKPIGAMCIAPALLAKILGTHKPKLTIGNDKETASNIDKMGGVHQICTVSETFHDKDLHLFTTPAYMLGQGIFEVYSGIETMVCEMVASLNQKN